MASMISFPVLQYSFRKSELLRETVPLLAYSVEGNAIKYYEYYNIGINNYI